MAEFVLALAVIALTSVTDDQIKNDPSRKEAERFLNTVESLQQPIEDFRCEFEGTVHWNRMSQKLHEAKLGEDGLYQTFSGVFIWRRGGDFFMDLYRRDLTNNTIWRNTAAVRWKERTFEEYKRSGEGALVGGELNSIDNIFMGLRTFPIYFFSIVYLRHDTVRPGMRYWFEEDRIDGRAVQIMNVGFSNHPEWLWDRYWIDLGRTGQVCRREGFAPNRPKDGKSERTRQTNIKLSRFEVGGNDVWMPVSAEQQWYSILDPATNQMVHREDDPWQVDRMAVVNGTMEFNKHPGPEVFTIKYKPGTPISDNLRKVQFQFGQQKIPARLTKAGAEKLLDEQLAAANEQKSTLVAAPVPAESAWTGWMAWGFGGLVVVSAVLFWLQRRGG